MTRLGVKRVWIDWIGWCLWLYSISVASCDKQVTMINECSCKNHQWNKYKCTVKGIHIIIIIAMINDVPVFDVLYCSRLYRNSRNTVHSLCCYDNVKPGKGYVKMSSNWRGKHRAILQDVLISVMIAVEMSGKKYLVHHITIHTEFFAEPCVFVV